MTTDRKSEKARYLDNRRQDDGGEIAVLEHGQFRE